MTITTVCPICGRVFSFVEKEDEANPDCCAECIAKGVTFDELLSSPVAGEAE